MAASIMTDYGYTPEGNELIDHDAAILARMATAEQIEAARTDLDVEMSLWVHFVEQGGADWHTGASWGYVRAKALRTLKGQS